jgi:uncharacterized protein YhaN
MKKLPLHIKDLFINKIAGFPRGMSPYDDLSPQINIIAGPNASGKSTTAKAIQKIIWRNQTEGLQIDGNVTIGNDPWAIRIDSNQVKVQRNGKEDELTGLPAVEEQGRYLLALHQLVSVNENDLAQHIINESIGGYDLDKARDTLEYSEKPKPSNIREYKDYVNANQQVKKQKEKQEKLKKEQEKLSGLYEKKAKAEEAAKLKEFYTKVVDYLETKLSLEQKKEQFGTYPVVLEKTTGEEYETISKLEGDINKAQGEMNAAEGKIDENREILNQLTIPESGISNRVLIELEERVDNIQQWKDKIDETETEKIKFETLQQEILKNLGEIRDTSAWDGLELQEVAELEKFLQAAHRTASSKRFFEKEIEELEKLQANAEFDTTTVLKGIDTLSQWLQEPRNGSAIPNWIVPSVLILAALGISASFVQWEFGLLGLILIFILALYGFYKSRQKPVNQHVKIREEDYRKTRLSPPDQWDAESVRERLEMLITDLQDAEWQQRINRAIGQRKEQIGDLQKQVDQVKKTAGELLEKFAALPELPFDDPQHYDSLYWFIIQVQRWQKANDEVNALKKSLEKHEENYTSELKLFTDICSKYTVDKAEDATQAKAIFRDLNKQETARQVAVKEIETHKKFIEDKEEAIINWVSDLKKIYIKLDVDFGNKDNVRDLLKLLDEFRKAKQEYQLAEGLFSDKKIAIESHSRYNEEKSNLEKLTIDQAKDKLNTFIETASALEEINKTITEIERDIVNVRGGNSLENALNEQDEAILKLKQLYHDNLSLITGQILINRLKKELREQNRPRVFKKANKLFNRITRGRYNLDVDEKEKPEFIAYDNIDKEGKTLDQLSTGTRIQLLFSVRMAFIETQESAITLPILADELLANSDDIRANAIIDALTEISKDGRQVFYFTAQADEASKWKACLSNSENIDFKIIELPGDGVTKKIEYDGHAARPIELLQNAPKPDKLGHIEYGKMINPSTYHLMENKPSELHLWYVIDEVNRLYRCLSQGMNKWGQLESFLEHGGTIEGLHDETVSMLKDKVRLLELYQDLIQQGHPKRIDRTVIEQSGAVSDKFIDEVSQKLNDLNGNPKLLIDAMRNGEISRFQSSKIDELESCLVERGFIDEREKLNDEDIQSRIQAYISNLEIDLNEAEEFLRRVTGST